MTSSRFLPVLLGSDINAYGMARAFHEEYGISSVALASFALAPTRFSKIVSVEVTPRFSEAEVFLDHVLDRGRKLAKQYDHLLLIPCGDTYAELVSRFQEELSEVFLVASPRYDLFQELVNKASFYALCEKHQIAHPATMVITAEDVNTEEKLNQLQIPFSFPVALKPADSVSYLDVKFEGRKKAYVLDTFEQVKHILTEIYKHGYQDMMILQEYIPGDDTHMRVLNAYVDSHNKVRMMCAGNPLLEDHAPDAIGNYTAIRSTSIPEIYEGMQKLLEGINYRGFVNFDLKYDSRDSTYKVFELNPRQGRSSYFTTLAGYNLARYLVNDVVLRREDPPIYGSHETLWLQIPKKVFFSYVGDTNEKVRSKKLIASGDWGTTLRYKPDMNFRRRAILWRMDIGYIRNYKKHFIRRDEKN